MICLGVDPDTFNTGIALVQTDDLQRTSFRGGKAERSVEIAHPKVLWATSVVTDPERNVEWRLIQQVKGIADALLAVKVTADVNRVAVETMRHYTGKTRVRPQDLIHLNEVAGGALGAARVLWPGAKVWDPKPQAWKGTIRKDVHQRRTLGTVGLHQISNLATVPGCEGLTNKQLGHIVDAIGLALKVSTHYFPRSLRK